jgi:hypothetical protein
MTSHFFKTIARAGIFLCLAACSYVHNKTDDSSVTDIASYYLTDCQTLNLVGSGSGSALSASVLRFSTTPGTTATLNIFSGPDCQNIDYNTGSDLLIKNITRTPSNSLTNSEILSMEPNEGSGSGSGSGSGTMAYSFLVQPDGSNLRVLTQFCINDDPQDCFTDSDAIDFNANKANHSYLASPIP